MASPRKSKKSQFAPITAIKNELIVSFTPHNESQQLCVDLWARSRIMFLLGEAGTGKSHVAMALSLTEILNMESQRKPMLMMTRPMVTVDDEEFGFLPGTSEEKLLPWLAPLSDVYSEMTFAKWDKLQAAVDLQMVPIGMLRGRTIRNGVCIIDEAQDMSESQLKCALTRIGRNGRLILCGDPDQSSRYAKKNSPLLNAANKLFDLDTVATIKFTPDDQVRDPLVSEILRRL